MQMPFSKLAKRSEMGNKAKRLVISRYGCVCFMCGYVCVVCLFVRHQKMLCHARNDSNVKWEECDALRRENSCARSRDASGTGSYRHWGEKWT